MGNLRFGPIVAIAIAVFTVFWVTSGDKDIKRPGGAPADAKEKAAYNTATSTPDPEMVDAPATTPLAQDDPPFRVKAVRALSQTITQNIQLTGRTLPHRSATLRAEITGKVIQVLKDKGQWIEAGEVLLQTDPRDWPARLREAQALVKQRELEYKSNEKLVKDGLQPAVNLAQANTQLQQAKAQVTEMTFRVNACTIRAPFSGILNTRLVELGDLVREGDEMLQILDYSPYLVRAEVPEQKAPLITLGSQGRAVLATGEAVTGQVRYISSAANPATRTFEVELEIANEDNKRISEMSAQLTIDVGQVAAHKVNASLLVLDDNGELGIKIIDRDNRVQFQPITVIKNENDGIWVQGLPVEVQIIAVGQGFVEPGQRVTPVFDDTLPNLNQPNLNQPNLNQPNISQPNPAPVRSDASALGDA